MIRDLVALGYEVHVSAPHIDSKAYAAIDAMGAHPHSLQLDRTGLNPIADLRYFREMLALIRGVKPGLVVNYTIKPNIWGSFAARLIGVPVCSMVTGLGYVMIEGAGFKRRLVQGVAKRLYAAALAGNRVVIFQNDDDVRDFVRRGIVSREKVRTIRGSGVNLAHFSPRPLPPEPVFLMIARLLKTKGVSEYVEAAKATKQRHPHARFLLVGMPDNGPDGISASETGDWQKNGIEYLGPQSDVRSAIASASVYVLPSYREGTPRSVLEAMAMGRPILTTDVPGCRETVRPGENGLLVPARDSTALRDAMIHMVSAADERAEMGRVSLEMARELFDVSKVNLELFRHLSLVP